MLSNDEIIKRLTIIEENAKRIIEDAAALKEELSGGSDSSILKPVLSLEHKEMILKNRHKTAFKKG